MADETPPARGFSSGSQGSSEGAPRLRGADVSVPCCWSLRNSSKWPGPTSSGPFLSLKSVCAEDRSRRQHHTAQAPAGAPGLCRPRRSHTCSGPRGPRGAAGTGSSGGFSEPQIVFSPKRPLPLWAPPFLTGAWAPPRAPPVQAELEQLLPKATTPGPPADPGLEGLGSSPTFHPAPAAQSHFRRAAWPGPPSRRLSSQRSDLALPKRQDSSPKADAPGPAGVASSAPAALAALVPSSGRSSTLQAGSTQSQASRETKGRGSRGGRGSQTGTLVAPGGPGARTLVVRLKCSTRQLLKPPATGQPASPGTRPPCSPGARLEVGLSDLLSRGQVCRPVTQGASAASEAAARSEWAHWCRFTGYVVSKSSKQTSYS